MESLTAKIIAFSLELPEFYVSFFKTFLKRLSIERCRLHPHADRPSLKVAVSFNSKNFVQNIRLNTRGKNMAELEQNLRIYDYGG